MAKKIEPVVVWPVGGRADDTPKARRVKPRAAARLGAGASLAETARLVGMSEPTIRAWLDDPAFQKDVAAAQLWWREKCRELELERALAEERASGGGFGTSGRKRDENAPRPIIDPFAVPRNA